MSSPSANANKPKLSPNSVMEPDDFSHEQYDEDGNQLGQYDPGTVKGPGSKWASRLLARGKTSVTLPEARRTAIRAGRQRRFLAAYGRCGSIGRAEREAKVGINQHHKWMREDPGYKAAFEEVQEMVGDMLEDVAIVRAIDGTTKDVYYQGEVVGQEIIYHDGLLKFLLKGAKPFKYGDRLDLTMRGRSLNIIIDGEAAPVSLNAPALRPGDEDWEDGEYVGEEIGNPDDADFGPRGGDRNLDADDD